jgi:hypothetical protein
MTPFVWFTLLAFLMYLGAERILDLAERRAGRRFKYRSLIFFSLLFGMATVSFALVRRYTS